MPVSRRQFLQNSALAVIGCATAANLASAGSKKTTNATAPASTTTINLPLGRQSFAGEVGSSFEVLRDGGEPPVWLQLTAVSDLPKLAPVNLASMSVPPPKHTGPQHKTMGFILSFSGGSADGLRQGTYTLESSTLGKFSLFIVPAGIQAYTAVFNRLM